MEMQPNVQFLNLWSDYISQNQTEKCRNSCTTAIGEKRNKRFCISCEGKSSGCVTDEIAQTNLMCRVRSGRNIAKIY